jgi:hypothetical protein
MVLMIEYQASILHASTSSLKSKHVYFKRSWISHLKIQVLFFTIDEFQEKMPKDLLGKSIMKLRILMLNVCSQGVKHYKVMV